MLIDAQIVMKRALDIAIKDNIRQKDISRLLESYFELCASCQYSIDDLYITYLAKNCLNKFRQDHGYKDGSYKKSWNGIEDNEYLIQILLKNKKIKLINCIVYMSEILCLIVLVWVFKYLIYIFFLICSK